MDSRPRFVFLRAAPISLLISCIFAAAALGCDGGASPPPGGATKVVAALVAGGTSPATASRGQTLASTYDAKAALYRQIAAAERAKVTASQQVVGSAAPGGVPASRLVSVKDALASRRANVAALADRIAAQAQATADSHRTLVAAGVSQ